MKTSDETKNVLFKFFRQNLLKIAHQKETWESPFLFQKENGTIAIIGYKSGLTPKAQIPSELVGLPVRKISARAFHHCLFLEEMHIEDGVEIIEANAFSACDHLTKIYMADSVRKIERNVFFECPHLFCAELSASLREIDNRAFYGCVGLRDIKLPDGIERIGEQAFYGCTKLKSINIPLALKALPRSAFDGCTALDHIYLEKGSPADKILSDSEYFSKKLRYIPRI